MSEERLASTEEILGHRFTSRELLDAALTHPSYAAEHHTDAYDRLEFLGDAVLGMVLADDLFHRLPHAAEGELTLRKHHASSGATLAQVADDLGIGEHIVLGRGAEASGDNLRASVLENVFEALVGALYLDGGLDAARAFIGRVLGGWIDDVSLPMIDPKSALQQHTQAGERTLPEYRVVATDGAPHERVFTVEVRVAGEVRGVGTGTSKQAAEKAAAAAALASFLERGAEHPDGS